MTTNLITVNPQDKLEKVKAIFDEHNIHHLPVVRYKEIVGIISKTDLLYFLKGLGDDQYQAVLNTARLKNYNADQIMTTGLAKLESTDRINVALEVFKTNLFHAIPIVDNDELVGILTTYDIIDELSREEVNLNSY
ncbi:MAG: CBS domain-containing protein [Bacteroidota bacterium]